MDPQASNYDPEAVYDDGTCEYDRPQIIVEGEITDSTVWLTSNDYLIRGDVYVRDGAVLLIDTGVVVKGEKNTHGTLIIQQGGQILAEGTTEQPVVFTSDQEEGLRQPGDWGGIIICGKAPNNHPGGMSTIEGIAGTEYGGDVIDDYSGFLRYIRIEYAGYKETETQERAGIIMASVGKVTVIDFVQVAYSGDDSFQWRGGLGSCGHLVSTKPVDDDFDSNYGHHGIIQFAVCLRDPNAIVENGADGVEADGDDVGGDTPPHTLPIFCNVSLFGPLPTSTSGANQNYNSGLNLRNSTRYRMFNSIVCGFKNGLQLSGSITENNATANELQIRSTILAGCPADFVTDQGSGFGLAAWFNLGTSNNEVFDEVSSLQLSDPFNLGAPDFLPQSGSPLLAGSDFSNPLLSGDPFLQAVGFRGAFGNDDWTAGWTIW